MADKVLINPTFRLDVNGKLFRNKNTNEDIQETILFNNLMTRLSINKGDLPLFPGLGLKQFFGKFNFMDQVEISLNLQKFETELEDQMNRECHLKYSFDKENKHVDVRIEMEGLRYPVKVRYFNNNGSIRVIEPQFNE